MGTTGEVLEKQGVGRRTAGIFCVAVVKEVLPFGTDTWVMTPKLKKSLEGTIRPLATPDKTD